MRFACKVVGIVQSADAGGRLPSFLERKLRAKDSPCAELTTLTGAGAFAHQLGSGRFHTDYWTASVGSATPLCPMSSPVS